MTLNSLFSKTWMKDTMKRYWIVPVLSFLGLSLLMFLCVQRDLEMPYMYEYISSVFKNEVSVTCLYYVLVGIITGTCVFRYLHDKSSSITYHSLPLDRKTLYFTSVITGLFMIIIANIGAGIVIFLLKRIAILMNEEVIETISNVISLTNVFQYLIRVTMIEVFSYSITVLGAITSGTLIINLLSGLYLNVIVPVMTLIIHYFSALVTYGYNSSLMNWLEDYLPVRNFHLNMTGYEWRLLGLYLIISCVILAISYLLYKRVPLEKENNTCVFDWTSEFYCVTLTFIFSTIITTLITLPTTFPSKVMYLIVLSGLSIVIYVICRMIADSTLSVFNKKTLKRGIIYIICVLLIESSFLFDIFNLSGGIPAREDIKDATIYCPVRNEEPLQVPSDKINDLLKLQSKIVEVGKNHYDDESVGYITINYFMKDGDVINRSYTLYQDHLDKGYVEDMKSFMTSSHLNKEVHVNKTFYEDKYRLYIDKNQGDEKLISIDSNDKKSILDAYTKDLQDNIGEHSLSLDTPLYLVVETNRDGTFYLRICENDKHIQTLLREKKYL